MNVDKVSDTKFINLNKYRKLKNKKEGNNNSQEKCSENKNAELVDFKTYAMYHPNIRKSEEVQLMKHFMEVGRDVTYENVQNGIKKYYEDSKELYPIFQKAEDFIKEFEDKIQTVDFSEMDNVYNIFGDGTSSSYVKRALMEDCDYVPSKESRMAMKSIAKNYVDIINENLPEYKAEIEDDGSEDIMNKAMQISISRGDDYILLFYEDFIESLKKGRLTPNVNVIISTPKENDSYYIYEKAEDCMNKIDKLFNGIIGTISKEAYDSEGNAKFYIDDFDESGPSYYAFTDSLRSEKEDKPEINLDDVEGMDEKEIEVLKNMIENDGDIKRYYKKYGMNFVYSCVREGNFNLNIAQAASLLMEIGKYYSYEGSIPQEYVNNLVNIMEEEDHYIDEALCDTAQEMLIKELNSKKNHHNTLYSVLTYIKNNMNEDTLIFGENLTYDDISFKETDSIMEMLNTASPKQQNNIIKTFNKSVEEWDEDEYNPDVRVYDVFMHNLKKD